MEVSEENCLSCPWGGGGDGKVIIHLAVVSEMYGNLSLELSTRGGKKLHS